MDELFEEVSQLLETIRSGNRAVAEDSGIIPAEA
jgi:hypothetical protein